MAGIHTALFKDKGAGQPGQVDFNLALTGTGASAPTHAAGADNDNRVVSSITRNGAGDYSIVMAQSGRVLLNAYGATVSPTTGTSLWVGMANLTSGTVRVKLFGTAGATDIASNDVFRLTLTFKNSGA